MTEKEAIEILQEEHDYAQLLSYVNTALNLAISALEKQIPKKIKKEKRMEVIPKFYQDGTIRGTEVETNVFYCPLCDEVLCVQHIKIVCSHNENFCIRCGQALDWSDTE